MPRNPIFRAFCWAALAALAACHRPPAVPDPEQPPEPQAAQSHLGKAIQQPLDRARAVEDTARQAAQAQRAAVEAAGG